MPRKTQNPGDRNFAAAVRSGWVPGMVGGKLLGFALALLIGASIPKLLTVVLLGGVVGGMTGVGQKPKAAVSSRRNKSTRAYVFTALAEGPAKNLDDVAIDEEFNGVSGSESDRRSMKAPAAQPKLNIPMPAPPKMGGM
jgi:hypothetical protein